MSDYLNTFLFGIYPYICVAVLLIGSLIRFDREQYTWRATRRNCCGAARCGSAAICSTGACSSS